jgi:hypothetical protein
VQPPLSAISGVVVVTKTSAILPCGISKVLTEGHGNGNAGGRVTPPAPAGFPPGASAPLTAGS